MVRTTNERRRFGRAIVFGHSASIGSIVHIDVVQLSATLNLATLVVHHFMEYNGNWHGHTRELFLLPLIDRLRTSVHISVKTGDGDSDVVDHSRCLITGRVCFVKATKDLEN